MLLLLIYSVMITWHFFQTDRWC